MKTLLSLAFFVAGAFVIFELFFRRKPDALDSHLSEQKNLQEIGKAATEASLNARRPVATFNAAGPLDGVVLDPLAKDIPINKTVWLPTGWGSYSPIFVN